MEDYQEHPLRFRRTSVWPIETIALLVLLGALLFYFQYVTLEKFEDLRPAIRYVLGWKTLNHFAESTDLGQTDAILAGSILALFVLLVIAELLMGP